MDWNTLKDLFTSNNDTIKLTAIKLNKYKQELDDGQISIEEFKELSNDLLDLKKIDKSGQDLAHSIAEKQAFNAMIDLVKMIPIL